MRLITLSLILAIGLAAVPQTPASAQDTAATVKKPPSRAKSIIKRLADTAATAAAGAGVQTLLGKKAGGVANALGVGATNMPCGQPGAPSSGAAIVGVAKGIVKKTADTTAPVAVVPCPVAAAQSAVPAGLPGSAAAIAGALPGGGGMPGGGALGTMAALTPIGMAVTAAPLAGAAFKGMKGMLGGKPQDKIAMLRELGKGALELKGVKFIEGTAEMEPGFEPSFAALGEAVGLAEGSYLLYVAAESGEKGAAPDTALARKRLQKVWAAALVNGVSDQRIIPVAELPKELREGRKAPKPGQARVEIIRVPAKS